MTATAGSTFRKIYIHHSFSDGGFGLFRPVYLKNAIAGRASVYHLFPFTAEELGTSFSLSSTLEWGTLPALLGMETNVEKVDFLQAYAHTYLKEEIGEEQAVRRLEQFRKFLAVAAQCNGQIVNFKKIADDVGVSSVTVRSYFQVLEDTLVGFFLEPFHESIRKSQRQNPKFYLFDSGVGRALSLSLHVPLQERSNSYGSAFEAFIINEIFRLKHYQRADFTLSYLRTKDDAEIDLIIDSKSKGRVLIEIKSTEKVTEAHCSPLARFAKDIEHARALLISRDNNPKKFGSIFALPWQQALKELF